MNKVTSLFQLLDRGHDGFLTEEDFHSVFAAYSTRQAMHEKFETLRSRFDFTQSGRISLDDFVMGVKLAALDCRCSTGEACQANLRAWLMLVLKEANQAIASYIDEIYQFCCI
jgi:Ca2+-binding EF-hand superfamily protein